MIEFKTVKNAEGQIIKFVVSGHSGYGEEGTDIVCAAVSSAVWMALNGIEAQNLAELDYKSRDGFVECTIYKRNDSADAILKSLELFISELSGQYKENIRITDQVIYSKKREE